jgi:hypothetical protein
MAIVTLSLEGASEDELSNIMRLIQRRESIPHMLGDRTVEFTVPASHVVRILDQILTMAGPAGIGSSPGTGSSGATGSGATTAVHTSSFTCPNPNCGRSFQISIA